MPDSEKDLLRVRPLEVLVLLPTGILCGVLMGAILTAINCWISPSYFGTNGSGWNYVDYFKLWKWSVQIGICLGFVFGLVSSLILVIGLGFASKLRCPVRMALRVQLKVFKFSFLFWLAGGFNLILFFILISYIFPRPRVFTTEDLKFFWAAGSTWGIYIGSVLSIVGALFHFAIKWRQLEKQSQA